MEKGSLSVLGKIRNAANHSQFEAINTILSISSSINRLADKPKARLIDCKWRSVITADDQL